MVMVYAKHSYRRTVMLPLHTLRSGTWRDRRRHEEMVRASYDANAEGTAAPATEFSSTRDVRRMFAAFSETRIKRENFDDFVLNVGGRALTIRRALFLNNVARLTGSDLYVTARK
jgi:hypothetical protein